MSMRCFSVCRVHPLLLSYANNTALFLIWMRGALKGIIALGEACVCGLVIETMGN